MAKAKPSNRSSQLEAMKRMAQLRAANLQRQKHHQEGLALQAQIRAQEQRKAYQLEHDVLLGARALPAASRARLSDLKQLLR